MLLLKAFNPFCSAGERKKQHSKGYIIAARQIIVVFRLVQESKAPRGPKGRATIYRFRIAKAGPGAGHFFCLLAAAACLRLFTYLLSASGPFLCPALFF